MKFSKTRLLAIGIMALTIASCSKSSSSPDTTTAAGSFKGTVGATPFTATAVSAAYTTQASTMDVVGSSGADLMSVGIASYKIGQTGIFTMSNLQTGGFAHLSGTSYYSKYGTVTLTSASSTAVAGSFSYTCKDSTKVNGTFNASVHILP